LIRHNFPKKDVAICKLLRWVFDSLKMLVVLTVEVVDGRWDEELDIDGRR